MNYGILKLESGKIEHFISNGVFDRSKSLLKKKRLENSTEWGWKICEPNIIGFIHCSDWKKYFFIKSKNEMEKIRRKNS